MEKSMVTWIIVGVVVAAGAGFGAGWGLRGSDTSKVIEHQTELIAEIQGNQTKMLEAVNKPVVIDAELRATLAEIPVQCLKEYDGNPNSVQCQWATCLQYGQSSAQRPECSDIRDLLVETLQRDAQAPVAPAPAAPVTP
jgi:hypothetical protein